MAVDYREVNQQLDTTANQLPFQQTLFHALKVRSISLKWITYGDITLRKREQQGNSSYHTLRCILVPIVPFWNFNCTG
jgi:hypothetical protein